MTTLLRYRRPGAGSSGEGFGVLFGDDSGETKGFRQILPRRFL